MAAPQYPIALNSLQKEFKECYEKSRKSIKLPQYILKDLEQYTLFLADLELNDEDCPILGQFLTSKLAASKIDKLMVGPKTFSIIPHARRGDSKNEASHSALNLDKSKLWKAVIKFIEKSENLKFVVVDSVFMSLELIHMLGLALSATKSKIKWFGLKNVPLEDRGLRLLSPHLAKSSIQLLALEKCGLTDQSTSYLASIIKAQEAHMDSLYWNLTLRQASSAADSAELMSSGLLALSISGNKLNGESHMALAKVIKRNDWLLALNMGRNEFSREAILSFMDAIKSNEKCHVIVFNGNPGLDVELNEEIVKKFQKVSKASSKFSVLSSNVASVVKKWIAETENFQVETPVVSTSSSLSLNNNVNNTNINNNKLSASFADVEGSIEFENDYLNTRMNLPSSHSASNGRVDESSSNIFLFSSIQDTRLDALEHGIPSSPQLNSFDILESGLSDNSASDKRPPSRSGVRQRHVKNFDNHDLNTSNSNFNLALASFNSVLPAQEAKVTSNFDNSANISISKRPQSAPPAPILTAAAGNSGLASGRGGKRVVSNTSINVKSSLEGALSKRLSTATSAASNSNSIINSSTRMKSRMTSSAITSSDTSILKKQPSSSSGGKSLSSSRVSPTRRGSASMSANNNYYNNNAGGSSGSNSNNNNNNINKNNINHKSNNNNSNSSSYNKVSSKTTIAKAANNTKISTPKKAGGIGKTKADQLTHVMEKMMDKMIETSQNLSNAAEKLNESLSSHSSMMANSRQDFSFLQESKLNSSNVFEDMDTSAHNSQNQNPFLVHGSGDKKQQLRASSNNSSQQVENQHMFSPNNRGGGGGGGGGVSNNNNNNNLSPRSPTRPQSASPYNSRDTSDILTAKFASASLEGNDGKEILQLIRDRLREKLKVHLSS